MLDPPPSEAAAALSAAVAASAGAVASELAQVAAQWPRLLDVWAALGRNARAADEVVAAYAFFRVGYHRGLDALRAAGWRGSGYARWEHPTNRGFLRCLLGLQRCAAAIAETDEAERCAQFLAQLDPSGVPDGE